MGSTIPGHDGQFGCPEPAELLSITARRDGEATVLSLCGEIDLFTAPLLSSALEEALDGVATLVVVDLDEVAFMASSGIAALLEGLDRAAAQGCRLCLAGGGRPVRRPLEAAGLSDHFEHYPTVTAALVAPSPDRPALTVRARTVPSPGTL